jgi:hypothetical protein
MIDGSNAAFVMQVAHSIHDWAARAVAKATHNT